MVDVSRKSHQSSEKNLFRSNPILMIGLYLSLMAVSLLILLLMFLTQKDISLEFQQVVVVFAGLLLFASFSAFQKIINPQSESSLLTQLKPYSDHRIITYNTFYNGDTYYNQKQNLVDAATEIEKLLNQLSQTYDESTIDKSTIDANLVEKIGETEIESYKKLTNKEKFIAAQVVEEIENNRSLKERLIKVMRTGGEEALKQLLEKYPAANIVLATFDAWLENEESKSTEKTINGLANK